MSFGLPIEMLYVVASYLTDEIDHIRLSLATGDKKILELTDMHKTGPKSKFTKDLYSGVRKIHDKPSYHRDPDRQFALVAPYTGQLLRLADEKNPSKKILDLTRYKGDPENVIKRMTNIDNLCIYDSQLHILQHLAFLSALEIVCPESGSIKELPKSELRIEKTYISHYSYFPVDLSSINSYFIDYKMHKSKKITKISEYTKRLHLYFDYPTHNDEVVKLELDLDIETLIVVTNECRHRKILELTSGKVGSLELENFDGLVLNGPGIESLRIRNNKSLELKNCETLSELHIDNLTPAGSEVVEQLKKNPALKTVVIKNRIG